MDNVVVHDLAQLDDLWFEFFLNEIETIENGVVVLIDMKGWVEGELLKVNSFFNNFSLKF